MLVYRIGHKNYASKLAASGVNGRWASAGKMVIYCADSISLAFLENMVRRQGVGFNEDFKTVIIEIPDDLALTTITERELEDGWRDFTDYTKCQKIGNLWYDEMKIPILRVPSAVLPETNNFVINANHPDFKNIKILKVADLVPDKRIDEILKHYKKS